VFFIGIVAGNAGAELPPRNIPI